MKHLPRFINRTVFVYVYIVKRRWNRDCGEDNYKKKAACSLFGFLCLWSWRLKNKKYHRAVKRSTVLGVTVHKVSPSKYFKNIYTSDAGKSSPVPQYFFSSFIDLFISWMFYFNLFRSKWNLYKGTTDYVRIRIKRKMSRYYHHGHQYTSTFFLMRACKRKTRKKKKKVLKKEWKQVTLIKV